MIAEARAAGVPVNVSLSTVFLGCPFEGEVSTGRRDGAGGKLCRSRRARRITLRDTTGNGPSAIQVGTDARTVPQRLPETGLTIHLHNTRGMGLANAAAAWETGVTRFAMPAGRRPGRPARMHREPARKRQYRGTRAYVRLHGRTDRRGPAGAARCRGRHPGTGRAREHRQPVAACRLRAWAHAPAASLAGKSISPARAQVPAARARRGCRGAK
ncbi:hypothetical protein ACTMU2_08085 [Cupriavidus basilensis]